MLAELPAVFCKTCVAWHKPDSKFYVSQIRTGSGYRLLLGPYDSHEEAESNVLAGRAGKERRGMSETKYCPKCDLTLDINEFSWRDKEHTGRAGWCRSCVKAKSKACRLAKIEKYRATNRRWNDEHRDQLRAKGRAYYHAHIEQYREANRRWYAKHAVAKRESDRRRYYEKVKPARQAASAARRKGQVAA